MTRARLATVSTETAYRVPWAVERADGRYTLHNLGNETLTAVTLSLYGSGMMPATGPLTLRPGEVLQVVIAGPDLARDTIAILRWFRPSGEEYLWRISF